MSPDVSVIIATYNVEAYISRAVESALNQTGVSLEVVIIDDCSTDNTWDVITALNDPRIKRERLAQNGGPSAARNRALELAAGRYIAILDGDDRFLPGRLQRCVACALAESADIVVDNVTIARESDGDNFVMFSDAKFKALRPLDLARFIEGNRLFARGYTLGYLKPIFASAFLRQHNLFYDVALRIGEDYLLFASALAAGAVCAIEPEVGYVYTVRAGSISHRLSLIDIDRMQATDARFLSGKNLDRRAARAQARRSRSLLEARAYTLLVDALKRRHPGDVVRAICLYPRAMRLLWLPIAARLACLRR